MRSVFVIGWLMVSCITYAHAAVSSSDLINHSKDHDGKTVIYEGEIIGDKMERGEYIWLNVNDGLNAIGVFAKNSLAKSVKYCGNYGILGDKLEISGVFNRTCLEHGGDMDIHAVDMRIIAPGKRVPETVNPGKIKSACVLFFTLTLVLAVGFFRRKQPRDLLD